MRIFTIALLLGAAAVAAPAQAATTVTFPNDHATCIAQAWVPSNTDPTQPSLGSFLRLGTYTRGGALRQNDC
jgi:hypothetical protein